MNVWAYKSDRFGSTKVPFCDDGNSVEAAIGLRSGEMRWDRSLGFTDLDDLVAELRALAGAPGSGAGGAGAAGPIATLAIQCHGLPGQLEILANHGILHTSSLSSYTDRLQAIAEIMRPQGGHGSRPLVIFMSCTAASPPAGTELFGLMSGWMTGVRLVGFTTILSEDATTPRDLPGGHICLPPDLRVTEDLADSRGSITDPGGSSDLAQVALLPLASPRSRHAREFLNGNLVWEWRPERTAAHPATGQTGRRGARGHPAGSRP